MHHHRFRQHSLTRLIGFVALCIIILSGTGDRTNSHALAPSPSTTDIPWKIVIVSDDEPGEPLIVSGIVYGPDGRTSLKGMIVEVHHTDARGYYSRDGKDEKNPRLRGRMRTNAEGRYEFRTIKPAPYPGQRNPAHIHIKISGPGYPNPRVPELWFEGDPFIPPDMAARFAKDRAFSPIRPLTRDKSGVLRCVYNIRLQQS